MILFTAALLAITLMFPSTWQPRGGPYDADIVVDPYDQRLLRRVDFDADWWSCLRFSGDAGMVAHVFQHDDTATGGLPIDALNGSGVAYSFAYPLQRVDLAYEWFVFSLLPGDSVTVAFGGFASPVDFWVLEGPVGLTLWRDQRSRPPPSIAHATNGTAVYSYDDGSNGTDWEAAVSADGWIGRHVYFLWYRPDRLERAAGVASFAVRRPSVLDSDLLSSSALATLGPGGTFCPGGGPAGGRSPPFTVFVEGPRPLDAGSGGRCDDVCWSRTYHSRLTLRTGWSKILVGVCVLLAACIVLVLHVAGLPRGARSLKCRRCCRDCEPRRPSSSAHVDLDAVNISI